MFRRRWSGLPEDPDFPIDLEKLGYFIQPETDEIRSIANPNFYFKYFRTKNERHNDRQRFAFNLAVQDVIHARLEALGLVKIPLPPSISSNSATNNIQLREEHRHVPIFVSKDLHKADRVVVLFGEGLQQLGVLAHRHIGGQGGVDEGSVVSLVRALLRGKDNDDGHISKHPNEKSRNDREEEEEGARHKKNKTGIILANTGEWWWWPEGQRALTYRESLGVKMKSCVHKTGSFDPAVNRIPGSEDMAAHVRSIFKHVLADNTHNDNDATRDTGLVAPDSRIQIIAVGEASDAAETYLDENWAHWSNKVDCLAMLGDGKPVHELKDPGFKKFLRERARIYITTQAPLDTPLSNPEGNPSSMNFTSYGCPVLSSGETYYVELTLIKAKNAVLAFLEDSYQAGIDGGGVGGIASVNPVFEITYNEENVPETPAWGVDERDNAGIQED